MASSANDPGISSDHILIEQVTSMTKDFYDGLIHLLPQLSSSAKVPVKERLDKIISDPNIVILIARLSDSDPHDSAHTDGVDQTETLTKTTNIAGMITVSYLNLLTGTIALIEDVVVDQSFQNRGIGKNLVRAAIDNCKQNNVKHIELTSRPQRVSANKLYEKMGFSKRETNVWRYVNQDYLLNI